MPDEPRPAVADHGLRSLLTLLLVLAAWPSLAHPHIWVTARAALVFAPDGKLAAVRHAWTFDEMTSASWLTDLGPAPAAEKLSALVAGMKEFVAENEYFTSLKANGTKPAFAEWREPHLTIEKGIATLRFELPLKSPAPASRAVVLSISDPTFFVDFQTAPGDDAVTLEGAPKGCVASVARPKATPTAPGASIGENLFKSLSEASAFSAQFASRSTVACP